MSTLGASVRRAYFRPSLFPQTHGIRSRRLQQRLQRILSQDRQCLPADANRKTVRSFQVRKLSIAEIQPAMVLCKDGEMDRGLQSYFGSVSEVKNH